MILPYRLHFAPDNASLIIRLALEELDFFSKEMRIVGVYPRSKSRETWKLAD